MNTETAQDMKYNTIRLVKPYIPVLGISVAFFKSFMSNQLAYGDNINKFEKEFGELIDNDFVLSVNSGTSALHLSLVMIGVGNQDEVISTALTAEPTNTVISNCGAKVVFADVDYNTGLISPESIESRITSRTKAIMVVHYAGMVCDMEKINKVSEKYNIPVIEDAAHSFLAKFDGKYIGSNSRFTCFSFQAIKHMTTIDGGMLCLTNEEDYKRAKKLRWFGLDRGIPRLENDIIEAGYKYNMNNVTAAIGLVQLKHLKKNVFRYIENGKFFDNALRDIPGVRLIPYYQHTEPSYWLYTIKVDNRDSFIDFMIKDDIVASPLHLRNDRHSVFKHSLHLPNLDQFYGEFVHIPCGWWVTKRVRNQIVKRIKLGGWV
jgi:dTDP-4-amino-4,6-dideoxygalactose transaminase